MGATKKHFYPEKLLRISNLCKALGHPARVSIVNMLSNQVPVNCNEMTTRLELSQGTVSHHCQILHRYGIIGYEVVGSNCFYKLDNRMLDQIVDFLDTVNTETPSITGNVYYPENRL